MHHLQTQVKHTQHTYNTRIHIFTYMSYLCNINHTYTRILQGYNSKLHIRLHITGIYFELQLRMRTLTVLQSDFTIILRIQNTIMQRRYNRTIDDM